MTLSELFDWSQDSIQLCANCPVILAAEFETLAAAAILYTEVTMTEAEVLDLFKLKAKSFSGCGANNSERYGVLRRNPKTGWKYLIDPITAI